MEAGAGSSRRGKKRQQQATEDQMEMAASEPTAKVQKSEVRKVSIPAHRYTPLKQNWMKIFTPIVENLGLQVRCNLKTRNVEKFVLETMRHNKVSDIYKKLRISSKPSSTDLKWKTP